jgi:hypothetical protein
MVATDSESYMMWICFFELVHGNNFKVCCFLAFGNSTLAAPAELGVIGKLASVGVKGITM